MKTKIEGMSNSNEEKKAKWRCMSKNDEVK
jgi:hypothetical protein